MSATVAGGVADGGVGDGGVGSGGVGDGGLSDGGGGLLSYRSAAGRWVVFATVLGSALAAVDATIVTIALPAIGRDLGATFGALQWTITGYSLTLASLVLLSGAAGDRFGRRRVFLIGVVWFTAASLLCAVAPTVLVLVAARVLQGVGGALLTPASLAILEGAFTAEDRGLAIGSWAGFSGVAGALAPFAGGWLLALGSWRLVFLVNLPLAVAVLLVGLRHIPRSCSESDDAGALDWGGAALSVALLGAGTYAIIGASLGAAAGALVAGVALVLHERRSPNPLVPLAIFRIRQFSAVNGVTFLVYAPIAVVFFLLVVQLQVVVGWSPIAAGASAVPVTLLTLLLSRRSGALAQRIGPRPQLILGPLLCTAAAVLALRIDSESSYVVDVLPMVTVLGLGLATMVAPLTATALSALPARQSGLASGINNAVARTAGLLAVAAVPVAAGLSGDVVGNPQAFDRGFDISMWICAALFTLGAGVAAAAVVHPKRPGRPAPGA
ncbi:MAG: MFS transporter [Ornithinibacter sp.]